MMKRIRINTTTIFFVTAGYMLFFLTGCNKDIKCPNGNICVQGTEITYQKGDSGLVLKLIIPPNAVDKNSQLFFDDLTNQGDFTTSTLLYAHSYFDIKPHDLNLLQLVKIILEYVPSEVIDDNNNNFEDDLKLYFVEDLISSKKWSIVNACQLDKVNHTVSAQIIHFGQYAVAAPKNPLIDEWRITPGMGTFEFSARLILYRDGTGTENHVVNCNPAGTADWQLSVSEFRWRVEQDSVITRYHYKPTVTCGSNGTTPDDVSAIFHVDENYLTIFDQYSLTWHRH